MKKIIENHILSAENENQNQIRRYFDQEKEYINSGHKQFSINFERKKIPVQYSNQNIRETGIDDLEERIQTDELENFVEKIGNGAQAIASSQGPIGDAAQLISQTTDKVLGNLSDGNKDTVASGLTGLAVEAATGLTGASGIATGIGVEIVKEVRGLGKPKFETRESGPSELNILNFKNDSKQREEFYKSDNLIGDMWEDDEIILEGSLKHLQIIQDSLSDKLPKIIHYEIFHSTKIFVQQEFTNALIEEWKQNKDVMVSNESQREKRRKIENDIDKYENALDIVNEMTRIIKEFQNQEKSVQQQKESTSTPSEDWTMAIES